MRRSLSVIAFLLLMALGAWAYAEENPAANASPTAAFTWSGPSGVAMPPEVSERFQRLMSMNTISLLRWPDKRISLDAKNTSIRSIAKMLGDQTGIKFTVKEAVPSSLKITIQVSDMGVKQFLDTLCAATNLTYTAESQAKTEKAADDKKPSETPQASTAPGTAHGQVTFTAPQVEFNQTGGGYEMIAPTGARIVVLNEGAGKPVTDVTISSLSAEGVIVNMGMVSMSVKDADPVEVATKLIKQISGASYMIMDLKDYISLQDPERAAEVEKALQKASRVKITMSFRNAPITTALARIAEAGHLYITNPQAGQSNFLIILDVKVVDPKVMPGLSTSWPLIGMKLFPPDVPSLMNSVKGHLMPN